MAVKEPGWILEASGKTGWILEAPEKNASHIIASRPLT